MLTTLALVASNTAWGCDRVEVEVDPDGSEVVVHNCWVRDHEVEAPEPPAPVKDEPAFRDELQLRYGMQFLPELPGHNLAAKLVGERDTYLNAELRYMPGSDLVWMSRIGAGFDVLPNSDWDITLGVFLGAAGYWDRDRKSAVLYAAPVGGGELAFNYEGERLFASYRLIGAVDTGRVPGALTENELTVGYNIFEHFAAYGQYLVLTPKVPESQNGVGMGLRIQI